MNSLFYRICLMVLVSVSIFGVVFSGPVPKEIWEDPCAGSNPVSELFPELEEARNFTLQPADFSSLLISLSTLITRSREYKQMMIGNIGNQDSLDELENTSGLKNFPTERNVRSGLITENSTLLTEDYERLSKLFIFVENSKLTRPVNIEDVEKSLLGVLENRILEILCKMAASGISSTSPITPRMRRILKGNPKPSNGSERNMLDYVMIRDMIEVIVSIQSEYELLV